MKRFCLQLALLAACSAAAWAQTAITSITTTTTPGVTTSADTPSVNFENTAIAINTFSTATANYQVAGIADQAFVRRATGVDNPNQSSVWYRDGIVGGEQLGNYSTSYAPLMLQNNLAGGSDNTFANGTTGSHVAQDGNIERLDFVFSGGMVANPAQVFAVFERGAVNAHDLFKIAVITGWDFVNNVPTSYGTLIGPSSSADWGTTNVVSDFGYHLFRYNTGDNLTTSTAHSETGTQGIGGIMFTMSQLGITPGTTIYGYSLFGNDVTDGGNSANLINYANSTYYPSATSNATGSGGIDLATVNGVSFSVIPEASTYALGGVAAMLGAIILHRRRTLRSRRTQV